MSIHVQQNPLATGGNIGGRNYSLSKVTPQEIPQPLNDPTIRNATAEAKKGSYNNRMN